MFHVSAIHHSCFRHLGVLLCLGTLTSCATLFKGTKADLTLTGPTDELVTLITSRDTFQHQQLPTTIRIKKKDLENAITVESDSYRFSRIVPGRKTDWWSVAQALGPFGLTGLVVDGITGALNLPKQNTYALTYVPKTDTVAVIPSVVGGKIVMGKKQEPRKFLRHELNLSVGLGNADQDISDNWRDELYENYHLESSTFLNSPYISLSGAYYYHFNRHWALGGLFGLNDLSQQMDNSDYHHGLRESWDYLSEYWMRQGNLGNALFYKDLSAPYSKGTLKHQVYYVLPAVKYSWLTKTTEVYSGLAIGVAYRHLCFKGNIEDKPYSTDRSCWKVGAQVTLIGIHWGKDHLGGFCELGVGHQGFLIGGLSYRF